jgi:hypothetical protein
MTGKTLPNEQMRAFDFVSDEKFRATLTSDYRELLTSIEGGAWKAVHVLAGSIIEAILVDYLVATDYQKRKRKDPLKIELADAIEACRAEGVLSQKAADLSSVIRSYRNLIHPGRVIRLGEKIDSNTSMIAKALVDVVVDEVSAAKADKYGFTAEQIANKLEMDSSSLSVLSHFLKETNEYERVRLLLDILPERYFRIADDSAGMEVGLPDLQKCFRQTFETLSEEKKAVIAKRFVKVLKEENTQHVFTYETAFFKANDLAYLSASEVALVKEHLLSRLEKERTQSPLLGVLEGLGRHLKPQEISRSTDVLMHFVAYGKEALRKKGTDAVRRLWSEIPAGPDEKLTKRLDEWITFLGEKGLVEQQEATRGLRAEFDFVPLPPDEEDNNTSSHEGS